MYDRTQITFLTGNYYKNRSTVNSYKVRIQSVHLNSNKMSRAYLTNKLIIESVESSIYNKYTFLFYMYRFEINIKLTSYMIINELD